MLRFVTIVMCLLLAGCGFRPLYGGGESSAAAVGLSQIAVQEQKSRAGQLLRNELLSARLGSDPANANYILSLTVVETGKPSVGTSGRVRYRMSADYQVKDVRTGKVVEEGKSFSTVAYDTVSEPLADLQAENNAKLRAARELGQDIKLRLAARIAG